MKSLLERLGSVTKPLSHRDFARVLSAKIGRERYVSASTVLRWLKNEHVPDAFEILAMAQLGETTVEHFLHGVSLLRKRKPAKRSATRVRGVERERSRARDVRA